MKMLPEVRPLILWQPYFRCFSREWSMWGGYSCLIPAGVTMSGESPCPSPVYLQARSPIRASSLPATPVCPSTRIRAVDSPIATNEAILQVSLYLSLVSRARGARLGPGCFRWPRNSDNVA